MPDLPPTMRESEMPVQVSRSTQSCQRSASMVAADAGLSASPLMVSGWARAPRTMSPTVCTRPSQFESPASIAFCTRPPATVSERVNILLGARSLRQNKVTSASSGIPSTSSAIRPYSCVEMRGVINARMMAFLESGLVITSLSPSACPMPAAMPIAAPG